MKSQDDRPFEIGSRQKALEPKDSAWPTILALLALVVAGVALFGGYQYFERWQAERRIQPYLSLHSEGWSTAELENFASRLEKLGANSCDYRSLGQVGETLKKKGNGKDAASFYSAVINRCPHDYAFSYNGWAAAQNSGDFALSLVIAEKLVKEEPALAAPRALRGMSNEALGELRNALGDYLSALEMLGEKSRISASEYIRLARTFSKLGEFCNAASILELFISFDPMARRTAQIEAPLQEYYLKGDCISQNQPSSVRGTKLGNHLVVSAVVNGIPARLLVDTGATFTVLSPALAQRAGVKFDGREMQIHGFNGTTLVKMGRLKTLTVGSSTTNGLDVVPLPQPAANLPYDGLLGMNFLTVAGFRLVGDRLELGTR